MKRFLFCLSLYTLLGILSLPTGAQAAAGSLTASAEVAVFSISRETHIRSCGETGNLSSLNDDEYLTFVLSIQNTGSRPIEMKDFSVSINGSEKYYWWKTTIQPGRTTMFHVYHSNMKSRMKEGSYQVTWYLDGQLFMEKTFTFNKAPVTDSPIQFPVPSASEIAQHNRTATMRSPYLFGYLQLSDKIRFSEYAVDFKADTLPPATYVSPCNMGMDLSALKKLYTNVHTETESITMYAGFQRRWTDYVSILSFWDVFYTDANGVQQTIRAKRIYPEHTDNTDSFTGEGTGAHALIPYQWESGHWYRMLLQCSQSPETDTTLVEQWVLDLESNQWTLLCKYDTGIPDSCFTGPVAFFLENFDPAHSGDVRMMEVRNFRIFDIEAGCWKSINTASIASDSGVPKYEGSYAYDASGTSFRMITSGVGGDWFTEKNIPQFQQFTITPTHTGAPY